MNRRARLARRILRDHRNRPKRKWHAHRQPGRRRYWYCPRCPKRTRWVDEMEAGSWTPTDDIIPVAGPLTSGQHRLNALPIDPLLVQQITPEMAEQLLRNAGRTATPWHELKAELDLDEEGGRA